MQGREPFDNSMDGMDMEVMKGFTWETIISRCSINHENCYVIIDACLRPLTIDRRTNNLTSVCCTWHRANLTRTSEEVSHYYVKHFLPLCVELCRPNATASDKASKASTAANDGTSTPAAAVDGSDTKKEGKAVNSSSGGGGATDAVSKAGAAGCGGTNTEVSDQLSFFPDPTRDVSEHSPVARGVAYIFLKRQQVTTVVILLSTVAS